MLFRLPTRRFRGVIFLGLTAAFAAGCSSQSPDPSADATRSSLVVQAGSQARSDGSLYFRERVLRAPPGEITILLANPATLEHNLAVRDGGKRLGITATIANGESAQLSLRLKPGRYVFFCAVPGHEASGMRGALIVG